MSEDRFAGTAADLDADYRHVDVDDVPDTPNPTRHKKEVDEAVGASTFGFNVYEAGSGEKVPWGYHFHPDHEELFYVLEGTLHVETPEEDYDVGAGEAFFVPEAAPNLAYAPEDDRVRFIAVGAPKERDGSVIRDRCPDCGAFTGRTYEAIDAGDERAYVLYCSECDAETETFSAGP